MLYDFNLFQPLLKLKIAIMRQRYSSNVALNSCLIILYEALTLSEFGSLATHVFQWS